MDRADLLCSAYSAYSGAGQQCRLSWLEIRVRSILAGETVASGIPVARKPRTDPSAVAPAAQDAVPMPDELRPEGEFAANVAGGRMIFLKPYTTLWSRQTKSPTPCRSAAARRAARRKGSLDITAPESSSLPYVQDVPASEVVASVRVLLDLDRKSVRRNLVDHLQNRGLFDQRTSLTQAEYL